MIDTITFKPLSAETWKDLETLFGPRGACGGCWCMAWRLPKAAFEASKGEGNRIRMKRLCGREPVGILAFRADTPIGWCAIAPRERYIRLETARVLKPIDDKPVWSVSCFFVDKRYRGNGLSVQLLVAATEYARGHGAKIIEGYPVEPREKRMPDVFAWTGILSSYLKAGFVEEKRRSPSRPIVRYYFRTETD